MVVPGGLNHYLEWVGVEHRQRGACIWDPGLRVENLGLRVLGFELRVEIIGSRVDD